MGAKDFPPSFHSQILSMIDKEEELSRHAIEWAEAFDPNIYEAELHPTMPADFLATFHRLIRTREATSDALRKLRAAFAREEHRIAQKNTSNGL